MTSDHPTPSPDADALQNSDIPSQLTVDVVSDVVCPWCFVGKRQLEQALQIRREMYPEEPAPQVRWHPFQLNPDMPAQGMARADYLQEKFGDPTGGGTYDNVRAAGENVGLAMQFDQISRQPNTVMAHALVAVAQAESQDKIVESLFAAYFHDGRDLTREEVLIEVARDSGIPEPTIEAALKDDSVQQAVAQADKHARELGITGVPFFIFNQHLAVSGAAGADTLLAATEKAMSGETGTSEQPAQ